MPYDYEKERPSLFKEENQQDFLNIRTAVLLLIETSGAVMAGKIVTGDSWFAMAVLDRLVELGEIERITPDGTWAQHQVYVKKGRT